MTKRQFRGDRLYKFSKVALAILMLLLAFHLLFGNTHHPSTHRLSEDDVLCDTLYPDTNDAKRSVCYDEATKNFYKNYDKESQSNKFEFILLLGLPTIFFGGTWLYKYLFPKNDSQKKVD